jgi:hypothetical protein
VARVRVIRVRLGWPARVRSGARAGARLWAVSRTEGRL